MTDNNLLTNVLENTPDLDRRGFLKMAGVLGGSALAATQLNGLMAFADGTPDPNDILNGVAPCKKEKPCCKKGCSKCDKHMAGVADGYCNKKGLNVASFPNLESFTGLSKNQIDQHLKLYEGYVNKTNGITESILNADPSDARTFRALHIDQSYSLNGALLHQYYFENIIGEPSAPSDWLKAIITKEFGSWDAFMNHFTTLGKKFRGWVVLGYNMLDHRVHNYGLDAHNEYYPAHVMPLLVMDVYEHAYMIDFGTNRGGYLDVFTNSIDWRVVEARLKAMALHYYKH